MTTPATEGEPETQRTFTDRVKKEGRHNEWHVIYTTLRAEGLKHDEAWYKSALEFGYTGPKPRGLSSFVASTPTAAPVTVGRARARIADRDFEAAVAELPPSADEIEENKWVKAHPALTRKSRSKANTDSILITREDLFDAKHGRYPSASAANKLQYWANNPTKVFEKLTDVMKKQDAVEDKAGEVIPDPTLDEVERMLKEFSKEIGNG